MMSPFDPLGLVKRHLAGLAAVGRLRNSATALGVDPDVAEARARELSKTTGLDFVGACERAGEEVFYAAAAGMDFEHLIELTRGS